jgi:hypothetical protein
MKHATRKRWLLNANMFQTQSMFAVNSARDSHIASSSYLGSTFFRALAEIMN